MCTAGWNAETMEIRISKNAADMYLVALDGSLDLYSSNQIKEAVMKLVAQKVNCIIINLQKVTGIASAGIGALIFISSTLKKMGCPLVIIVTEGPVMQALEVTRLKNFFTIASSLKEALSLAAEKTAGV